MPPVLTPTQPGRGAGWERLAEALRPALAPGTVDGVWVFRTMRAGPKEFGTAILTQVEGDRRRIFTARYALLVKGRQRGGFEWGLDEVGAGPVTALEELLALVPARGVEDEPPVAIDVRLWFEPPSEA
ncbi:MAG TPA: hypothetical protein VJU15_16085, partial [Gemmatimonadales bacterium]|nr:hypothetical protein [Gemmatimonadales bacterium]